MLFRSMSFHHWQAGDEAEATIGGVLQPLPAAPVVDAAAIDLFLTPLLGCGDSGMRLGYGGGFYDRTLEKLKMKKPVLAVGFAYSCQEIEQVPLEMTDQSLDFVITEKAVLDLRSKP